MSDEKGLYLPAHVAAERRRPRTLGELDFEVHGPDPRFQDHRAGCDCGNLECPWYRGEEAARRWARMSDAEKLETWREAATALAGEPVPFL